MKVVIRDVAPPDYEAVMALNQQGIPQVNLLTAESVQWFAQNAAWFRVAVWQGNLEGVLIAVTADCGYQSQYFKWFAERYADFLYIDRVVVAEWARGQRIAWRLLEDVEQQARDLSLPLVSDVYSRPPNEISLVLHKRFGFRLVGHHWVADETKEVAKFEKLLEDKHG